MQQSNEKNQPANSSGNIQQKDEQQKKTQTGQTGNEQKSEAAGGDRIGKMHQDNSTDQMTSQNQKKSDIQNDPSRKDSSRENQSDQPTNRAGESTDNKQQSGSDNDENRKAYHYGQPGPDKNKDQPGNQYTNKPSK